MTCSSFKFVIVSELSLTVTPSVFALSMAVFKVSEFSIAFVVVARVSSAATTSSAETVSAVKTLLTNRNTLAVATKPHNPNAFDFLYPTVVD